VARILIVGGGARGRELAVSLLAEGHAVRITTRSEARRAEIEGAGAECWVGTPARLATLRGSLDAVSVLCWLLGCAQGEQDEVQALHGPRLEFFLTQAIDTTVRGIVYEAAGCAGEPVLAGGRRITEELTGANAIPVAFIEADPAERAEWIAQARAAIGALLAQA
jgi:hypothetical protein